MTTMVAGDAQLRGATQQDAEDCGRIFYDAFASIAEPHGFPVEPGSPAFASYKAAELLATEGVHGVVAVRDGAVVGSAFADERDPVVGIGPVTVDPAAQDRGVGRALMEALLRRERDRRAPAVRLVQTAYHHRSLALYSALGFVVREPLSVLQGTPPAQTFPGLGVRPATDGDLAACGELCRRVHGHERSAELRAAIAAGTARVVERPGRLSGYATGYGYGWHAVGETTEDLTALLAAAEQYLGLGVLIPTRNAGLLGWCLANGLRIVQQSTLMTTGLYTEPAGAWMPSILY